MLVFRRDARCANRSGHRYSHPQRAPATRDEEMAAILEFERLSRRFGDVAGVDDLSFTVETGEIRGLIGPKGAGKITIG